MKNPPQNKEPNPQVSTPRKSSVPKFPFLCLAPMDGITDSAFRRVVRRFNPEVVVFSEFTNAEGFLRSKNLKKKLAFHPEEDPYFVQLFGKDPKAFRKAALELEGLGVAGIDINMGCPSKKVVASQHGSGLMRNRALACQIVSEVAEAVQIPVSVKTRLGWSSSEGLCDFVSALSEAGANWFTIHGRTYKQAFGGKADWEPIYLLKETLGVRVLGNGDLAHAQEGWEKRGPLDGVMIGRACLGKPWVFSSDYPQKKPSLAKKIDTLRTHYLLARESRSEERALMHLRRHLGGYFGEERGGKKLRIELMQTCEEKTFFQLCEAFLHSSEKNSEFSLSA